MFKSNRIIFTHRPTATPQDNLKITLINKIFLMGNRNTMRIHTMCRA